MHHQKITTDPQFRVLADQVFFTDRTDLDFDKIAKMVSNREEYFHYFWDRFLRSTEISWEESFWVHRFNFILSYNPKNMAADVESLILLQFKNLLMSGKLANLDPDYHNVYLRLIAWSKAKVSQKESVIDIQNLLLELPDYVAPSKIIDIVNHFTPFLFESLDDYLRILAKRVGHSAKVFEILLKFEEQGIKIDKDPLCKLANELLHKRISNPQNRKIFFAMINDLVIINYLKDNYQIDSKNKLLSLIKKANYKELEDKHLCNFKNLLELDPLIADELIVIYADSLYARYTGSKKSNVYRLIRVCKTFSQISNKKVLAYLSAHNRMSDIKYWLSAFPDLSKLAAFA